MCVCVCVCVLQEIKQTNEFEEDKETCMSVRITQEVHTPFSIISNISTSSILHDRLVCTYLPSFRHFSFDLSLRKRIKGNVFPKNIRLQICILISSD